MSYNLRLSRRSRFSRILSCAALLGTCVLATADTIPPVAPIAAQASSADAPPAAPPDAAETPASAGENSIEVRGVARPDDIPYSSFVAAMRAFDQYHHYAPDAPLLFSVDTHGGKHDNLRVSITGERVWISVPVDAKGHFMLPLQQDALDDKAVVMANKRDGEVDWGTLIRTPGLPKGALRLGDLRLECRASYALAKHQTSLWLLALANLFAGCNSDGNIARQLKRPGMRVKLAYQSREEILPDRYYVAHHTQWTIPLTDGDWPDDTLVRFVEPDSNFVLDSACADKLQHDAEHAYAHGLTTVSASECLHRPTDDDGD